MEFINGTCAVTAISSSIFYYLFSDYPVIKNIYLLFFIEK